MNVVYNWMASKKPTRHIVKYRQDGDFCIVYGESLEICYLNKTSGVILDLCNGKNTVRDIKKQMLKRFEVDESVIEDDLVDIIRNLQWKQLIVLEG